MILAEMMAEMSDLTLMMVLILTAAVFLILELITPSFGVLMGAGIISLGGAVVFAFRHHPTLGYFVLLGVLLGTPAFLYFMVRMLPKTPLSRRLFLRATPPAEELQAQRRGEMESLLGKTGTAETELRPSGKVKIQGHRYDARSESGLIAAGTQIKVIRATVMDVVVRDIKA